MYFPDILNRFFFCNFKDSLLRFFFIEDFLFLKIKKRCGVKE